MTSESGLARIAIRSVQWYQQHISARRPPCCKYYPSCSAYTLIAIRRFGFWRGGLLGFLRLLRCRPWSDGGIDDVPHQYSLFYRFSWSKAHEEPTTEPIIALEMQQKAAAQQEETIL